MRATGKTTRTVDDAIQLLFEYKHIVLPVVSLRKLRGLRHDHNIIYDEDWDLSPRRVQRYLYDVIKKRLLSEHRHLFDKLIFERNKDYYEITIK